MTRVATLNALVIGIAISANVAMASGQRVTGGDNAYYIAGETTPIHSNVEFEWPESRFMGGDGYDGPEESEKPFNVDVIHKRNMGGDK